MPGIDLFQMIEAPGVVRARDIPPVDILAITPNDSVDTAYVLRGLRIAGAGNVVVTTALGNDRTIAVRDNEILWLVVTRVKATGTTATGIEGLV